MRLLQRFTHLLGLVETLTGLTKPLTSPDDIYLLIAHYHHLQLHFAIPPKSEKPFPQSPLTSVRPSSDGYGGEEGKNSKHPAQGYSLDFSSCFFLPVGFSSCLSCSWLLNPSASRFSYSLTGTARVLLL